MKKLFIFMCALAALPVMQARTIIFDIHGVLLHEDLANFVKAKIYAAMKAQKEAAADKSIKDNPLFLALCDLMTHYRPLGEPTADYPKDFPLPYETYALFKGTFSPTIVHTALLKMMEQARADKLVDAKKDLHLTSLINAIFDRSNFVQTMIPLFEGIALLKTIVSNPEHQVYVYSNAPREWVEMYHDIFPDIFGLLPKDHVFCSGHTGHLKPAREAYQAIANHAGVPLESLMLIDDTQHNVDGAKAMGMTDSVTFTTSNFTNVVLHLLSKGVLNTKQHKTLEGDKSIRTTREFGERCLF